MPRFEEVEVTVKIDLNGADATIERVPVDVDFEVFCARCGYGLCSLSSTRKSRRRGEAQVEVNVCPSCEDDIKEEAYERGLEEGRKVALQELMKEIGNQ